MTEWISLREAAELTHHNAEYLRRLVRTGKIRAQKRGGRDWWIDRGDLLDYVSKAQELGRRKFRGVRRSQGDDQV